MSPLPRHTRRVRLLSAVFSAALILGTCSRAAAQMPSDARAELTQVLLSEGGNGTDHIVVYNGDPLALLVRPVVTVMLPEGLSASEALTYNRGRCNISGGGRTVTCVLPTIYPSRAAIIDIIFTDLDCGSNSYAVSAHLDGTLSRNGGRPRPVSANDEQTLTVDGCLSAAADDAAVGAAARM